MIYRGCVWLPSTPSALQTQCGSRRFGAPPPARDSSEALSDGVLGEIRLTFQKGVSAASNIHFSKQNSTERRKQGESGRENHQPVPSEQFGSREPATPLAISGLALSLAAPEPFSLLFGASRAFSFLACLVPLRWAKAWLCHGEKQKQSNELEVPVLRPAKASSPICVSYEDAT